MSEIEYMPFEKLLTLAEQKLADTVKRAYLMDMYRAKWKACNVKTSKHFCINDLKGLPLINRTDLMGNSLDSNSGHSIGGHILLWNSIDSLNQEICWLPRGREDVCDCERQALRIVHSLELDDNDRLLFLSQSAFGATNLLPYSMSLALKAEEIACHIIAINMNLMENMSKWLEFLNRNRPTVMIAQSDYALKLSRVLEGSNDSQSDTGNNSSDEKSRLLPNLKFILLYGADCSEKKPQVESVYQADVRLSIGLADLKLGALECSMQQGVHLWLDNGLYEIIPESDFTSENHVSLPWLWEVEPGTRGELVITSFSEILPLIRYRSGYIVEALGKEKCGCGRTHPRAKLAGTTQ